MRVTLFVTCLADHFFAEAVADAVRLLRSLGVDVRVPPDQTCCGQPAHNAGRPEDAARMAKHTLRVLEGRDPVVVPSGSCAAMLRGGYAHLVRAGSGVQGPAAEELASRTFELTEFLVRVLEVDSLGRGLEGRTVGVHAGCHALRELDWGPQVTSLLRASGAHVPPWDAGEECCGFGGLFSVKHPAVSAAMADRKLDTLGAVDVLTSADPGCLLQLVGRARHRGIGPPVRHVASLLWEAVDAR